MRVFEILTFIGATIGALLLTLGLFTSTGAPQEASAAALALAFVGLPYCVLATLQRREILRRSGKTLD